MYTSGQVAKMLGVTQRTLDHYRYEKLIHPSVVKKGESSEWFMYDESDIQDLYLIRLCRAADMKLSEIAKILKEDKSFNEKLVAQIDVLEEKRDKLNRQIKFAKQVRIIGSDLLIGAKVNDEAIDAMAKAYDSYQKEMRRYFKTFDKDERMEIENMVARAYRRISEAMVGEAGIDFEGLHSAAKELLFALTVIEQRPVSIMELPVKHLLLLSDDSAMTKNIEEDIGSSARESIGVGIALIYAYYAIPRLSGLGDFKEGNSANACAELEEVLRLSLGPVPDMRDILDDDVFEMVWVLIEMANEFAEDIVETAPELKGCKKLSDKELDEIKGEFLMHLKGKYQGKEA